MTLPPPPLPPDDGPFASYAAPTAPLAPMRSLRGLWIGLVALFALVAVVDIVGAAAFFNRASLLDEFADGGYVGADLIDADGRIQGAFQMHFLVGAVLAVTFIIWQYRHAQNARALGERGGLGPGWAIGGWFVPLANYVLPGVQIHQSSRMSDPRVAGHPGARGKGAGIVIVWMGLFAISGLMFLGGGGLRPTDAEGNIAINTLDDVRDAASSDRGAGTALVLFVGTAVAGGMMVRSLSTKQLIAYDARLRGGPNGAGPPAPAAPFFGSATAPAPPPPQPSPEPAPEPPTQWGTPPP